MGNKNSAVQLESEKQFEDCYLQIKKEIESGKYSFEAFKTIPPINPDHLDRKLGTGLLHCVIENKYEEKDIILMFEKCACPNERDINGNTVIDYFYERREYNLMNYCIKLCCPVSRKILRAVVFTKLTDDLKGVQYNYKLMKALNDRNCKPFTTSELLEFLEFKKRQANVFKSRFNLSRTVYLEIFKKSLERYVSIMKF
jgi:hypothetical protein